MDATTRGRPQVASLKNHVSPRELARAIGVSESSVKRWSDRGLIPVERTAGGHRRLPIGGVIQFVRDSDMSLRESAPPLPANWCGKQHACAVLAGRARHGVLVFLDADVRLAPDGLARALGFLAASGAGLVSGFPRQATGSWLERAVIPLIHFVLLGFLPMWRMRATRKPAYGAGCGQLFVARREAYEAAGGHGAVRASLHDGVTLPRAFRRAGFATDLFDATKVAVCRMYRDAGEVWRGLAKNATEGLAAPAAIVPWTVLLGVGQVLPSVLLLALLAATLLAGADPGRDVWLLALLGAAASYGPRLDAAFRFRQSLRGTLVHPMGVALLLAIQWHALGRKLLGRPAAWKGREYGAAEEERGGEVPGEEPGLP